MSLIRCKHEVLYCQRPRDTIDERIKVDDEDPQLQSLFFDIPYSRNYLLHGGLHGTRTLGFEVWQRTTVCSPLFTGWHNLELFAVPPIERHRYYVQMTPSWRELEARHMLCVLTPPMFAYYLGAFGSKGQPYS